MSIIQRPAATAAVLLSAVLAVAGCAQPLGGMRSTAAAGGEGGDVLTYGMGQAQQR